MPLNGEYEPSPIDRVREQVELYEPTNGVEGGTLNGKPVIVLTFKGVKSEKSSAKKRTNGGSGRTPPIRKSPPTEPVQAVKSRCSSWSPDELSD
jgi:hypothetical protein